MSLPLEAEELLDDLRRGVMDSQLREIAHLIGAGIEGEDLRYMQLLEYRILKAYHREDLGGFEDRQNVCEEIAKLHGVA